MDIRNFISEYENMTIEVTPGVSYNLRETIDENFRLYNGKFETENDASGLAKIFYRMIWVVFRTIIMSSDVDLKDLNIRSSNGQGIRTLALVKLAIHSHLLRSRFGKYIDQVMADMVWHGSSITKRVNGSVYSVDLRNYMTEPNIKDPQDRSHVEIIDYTVDELYRYKDKWENWADVKEFIDKAVDDGKSKVQILEFWTWAEKDGEMHKVCKKYLDRSDYTPEDYRQVNDWSPHIKLDEWVTPYSKVDVDGTKVELFPYEQADLFDCPGRFLGFGCAELLAGLQEHYNEQWNLKRKKDILDLRGIFVHKYTENSNSLTQEFLDNLETGDVVQMDINEDLQRLIIDTKTGEFLNNVDKLYEIMRLTMGVTAQGTGEELPASTSATGVKANFATQQTTYDFVRERMHHFIQGLFMNGYFEDIIEEISKEEMIAITGDPKDLAEIDRTLIEKDRRKATQKRYEELEKTGGATLEDAYILDELEKAETEQMLEEFKAMGDTRWASVKKELVKGLKYTIEFFINNETFDKQSKLEFLQSRLQDPNFTGSRKAVEDSLFDLLNENPRQFDKTPQEITQEQEMMRQQMMQEQQLTQAPEPIPGPQL